MKSAFSATVESDVLDSARRLATARGLYLSGLIEELLEREVSRMSGVPAELLACVLTLENPETGQAEAAEAVAALRNAGRADLVPAPFNTTMFADLNP